MTSYLKNASESQKIKNGDSYSGGSENNNEEIDILRKAARILL